MSHPAHILPARPAGTAPPSSSGSPRPPGSSSHATAMLNEAAGHLSLRDNGQSPHAPIASSSRGDVALPLAAPTDALADAASASHQQQQQKKKRGRKRLAEPLDDIKDNPSLDADAKRKLQNRAAQRAFRERKEKHMADLEERVKTQEAQLEAFRETVRRLVAENEALRSGQDPPRTSLPPDLTPSPWAPSASNMLSASPPVVSSAASPQDVKPALSGTPLSPSVIGPPPADIPHAPVPDRPAASVQSSSSGIPVDPSLPAQNPPLAVPPAPVDTAMPSFDDLSFDFDAPFDFSESITLPPLFSSLLDGGGGAVAGTGQTAGDARAPPTSDAYEDDTCPGEDDDDPTPLPGGRIPCDKPECDFSNQSCMLPIPWRPPTVSDEKHLWLAQKCWAKLLSHPLFSQVDADELCAELRNRTRCSTDGRLVCHKGDVCDIFRSIPLKAKLRAQALSMR